SGRRAARTLPGSGLGLAIVRQVAEAHGGSVVAERAEGGGTRMILGLQGRAEPSQAGPTRISSPPIRRTGFRGDSCAVGPRWTARGGVLSRAHATRPSY